jgi:hypothetical protein
MALSEQSVNLVVEGFTDEIVIRRIVEYANLRCGTVKRMGGKQPLLTELPKFNQAAQFMDWLVVLDLDHDADCAPTYIQTLLPNPSRGIVLRIAVREIEAWLLADRESLSAFLGISVANIPINPDIEDDPKLTLINLARRSRKTRLREDIVPRPNSGASVGAGYPTRIQEFVEYAKNRWRPEVAQANSDSLRRAIAALKNWQLI